MTTRNLLSDLPAYAKVEAHASRLKAVSIEHMFDDDSGRAERFTLAAAGLHLDYSKYLLDTDALSSLLFSSLLFSSLLFSSLLFSSLLFSSLLFSSLHSLAKQAGVRQGIADLFAGVQVNNTEDRPALHTLLRASNAGGQSTRFQEVVGTRQRMQAHGTATLQR